jgi:sulfur carrier protein
LTAGIVVNGEPTPLTGPLTLAALVGRHTTAERGVAVARNGAVVPRSAWPTTELEDGDAVEILTPVAGG